MAQFCTKCGTPREVNSNYCDHCGAPHPLGVSNSAVNVVQVNKKRIGLILVATLISFAALGGLTYLNKDSVASTEVLTSAISHFYEKNPSEVRKFACANWGLIGDTLEVSQYDSDKLSFMDDLANAGLYSQPEVHVIGGFFFSSKNYRYRVTPLGLSAIKEGSLCFASAINIKEVSIKEQFGQRRTIAHFKYDLKGSPSWLSGNLAERAKRALHLDDQSVAVLIRNGGKWEMVTDDVQFAESVSENSGLIPKRTFLQQIKDGIRTGNPLIGRWEVQNFGVPSQLNFAAEYAEFGTAKHAVTYELKNDVVIIYDKNKREIIRFYVEDGDHISARIRRQMTIYERVGN